MKPSGPVVFACAALLSLGTMQCGSATQVSSTDELQVNPTPPQEPKPIQPRPEPQPRPRPTHGADANRIDSTATQGSAQ